MMLIAIAFIAAAAVAIISYRARALTANGAVAATLVGGTIFLGGQLSAAILLLAFFLSGSLLSRLNERHAGARDWKQVLANGLVPAIAMLVMYLKPDTREHATLFFLGAVATATADTWATELGIRFGGRVVDVLTQRPIARGLSGGVTMFGVIASALGAFVIAALALIHPQQAVGLCHELFTPVLPVVTIAGFSGAMIDSIIGSKFQAKYLRIDGTIVESPEHGAEHASGLRWLGNNATNLISTLIGGFVAVGIAEWF